MIKFITERSALFFTLLIFASSVLFIILFQYAHFERPIDWDESDYTNAAHAGVKANAFEENSLSFIQLAKLGMAKVKNARIDLSEFPPEATDVFQLRHFHPPLPVYYWHLFLSDDLKAQDFLLQLSNILLSALLCIVILIFAAGIFSGGSGQSSFFAACLTIPFFITSDLFLNSFKLLNFHTFFLLFSVWFMSCLMNFVSNTSKHNAVWLGFSSAVLLCTLETSVFIFVGAALSLILLKQKNIFSGRKKFIAIIFIVSSVIIWPGIIKTLGPVKSWAMYVYRIFAVHNASYENVSMSSNLIHILKENVFLFLAMTIGYIKLFFALSSAKTMNRQILLPAITGLIYFIVMLPFSLNPTYIFPGIGLLFIGSVPGIIQVMESSSKIKFIFSALCIGYLAFIFGQTDFDSIKKTSHRELENFKTDLNEVKNIMNEKKPVLIDGARIFRYYLPGDSENINELFRISSKTSEFALRKNYEYVRQDSLIENRFYTAIVIGKNRNYTDAQYEKLKKWGYKFRELNEYYLFYL